MKKYGIALAVILTAVAAYGTEFWTPEELAEPTGPPVPPRLDFDAMAQGFDPDQVFGHACAFIEYWQVKDPEDPDYGGIREGEDLPNVIQSDNTQESVWVWSRWRELTGSDAYDDAVARSWTYLTNNPAWEEEGWGAPASQYYRIYNCGWGMRAEMMYRRATGNEDRRDYGLTCARFVVENHIEIEPLSFQNNYLCTAWAVGNLYEYAVDVGDDDLKAGALELARDVKAYAEEAPAWCIGRYSWAMSGGAVVWGLHNSYFREYPGQEKAWMEEYGTYLAELAEPGVGTWDNAWNGWFMLGHHSAYRGCGNGGYWNKFDRIVNNLVAQDTDNDGGIPPSQALDDTHDHTWVTSYLCLMGMDRIIRDLSVAEFEAATGVGEIVVSWEPAYTPAAAGYNLYREEEGTPGRPRLNDEPLTGEGSFEVRDEAVTPGKTYTYIVEALGPGDYYRLSAPIAIRAGGRPTSFALAQSYPNPTTGTATFAFSLAQGGPATFRIYDMAGRELYQLDEDYGVGKHELTLNLPLPPGVYVYHLESGGNEAARKMVLVK
ncbi:MAG: T9SS type A sorting domain-containing protein [Candidatus Zixiibacteriota bacterium]|jgi:hypothetical protein